MTELTPLAEAASSAVLLLFLGLPTAWNTKGFPQALCRQATTCWHVVAHVGLVVAGICIGIGAWIAKPMVWWTYVLVGLWSLRASKLPRDLWLDLAKYCGRRFYRPEHAA